MNNIRIFVLLCLAWLFQLKCAAQTDGEKDFIRTSIVAGISANQIDGDEIAGYTKPGLVVGGAARFLLSDKLGFQTEVLYAQKGARSTEDHLPLFIRWNLSYIEIPVLLSYEFYPRFSAVGGGAFGYLLGAKLDQGGGFINQAERFNKLDLQYAIGLDVQVFDELSLNMRLNYSIVPITKIAPNFYNNGIAVTLRYHL